MGRFSGGQLKIFTGNANQGLAAAIVAHLGIPLGESATTRFNNGEIQVMINESVRGDDVFVIQPTCSPPNDTLMELLIIIDALRRASARRITAVIPFYGYARQDRKTRGREPITAKLVANLITTAQADRVVAMDLHAGQIQGFFDLPVDHLTALPILGSYIASKGLPDVTVVSPDVGGTTRARNLADRLGATFGIIEKRRPAPGQSEVLNIIGEVRGRTVVLVDDIIDTGGSIAGAARALVDPKTGGARSVHVCCTHAVFSGAARQTLVDSPIEEVVVTNTIPVREEEWPAGRLKVLSVAPLLADAILRIHEDLSVSKLFE